MHHKHGWSIDEMDDIYPFELDIYASLLAEWLEMERTAAEEARNRG